MPELKTRLLNDNGLHRVAVFEAPLRIELSPQLYRSLQVHPNVPGCSFRDGILLIGTMGVSIGVVQYRDEGTEVAPGDTLLDLSAGYRIFTRVSLFDKSVPLSPLAAG